MIFHRQLFLVVTSLLFCTAAYAHEYGPDPGYAGAPDGPQNKTQTCIFSGCHVGTVNSNAAGSVKIVLPGAATTYVPGQALTIQVQITDASKRAYGFQMTARLKSNLSAGQAGDFVTGKDGFTQVLCDSGTYHDDGLGTRTPCPAQFPVQFVEHTLSGYEASISSKGSYTYQFTWTAPTAGAGDVTFYVAANAGPGDPPVVSPTNVYTSLPLTLTPAAAGAPSISNVLNGASYLSTIAANTYATVYGTNLSTTTNGRAWGTSDFTSNGNGTLNMPKSLDGTSVTVGGVPAYVQFVLPGQVNFIVPDVGAGTNVPVVLTQNEQSSGAFNVTMLSLAPSFFTWQPATADSGLYLIAQHQSDNTNVGKFGLFPTNIYPVSANFTTPAKPGELIVLYGTGFGPTSPPIAAGIETDSSVLYNLSPKPIVTIGGLNADVYFAGLAPSLSQVYQFDVYVPLGITTAGDYPLVATVNTSKSVSGLITVAP
jgi:uncharacterized protein (TIGR03437 family)